MIYKFARVEKEININHNKSNKIMRKLFTLRTLGFVLSCLLLTITEKSFAVGDAGVQAIITPPGTVCKGTSDVP